jgi:ABC-type bacteriocin/lantibiotic exporter with double-glycine peptidase domain
MGKSITRSYIVHLASAAAAAEQIGLVSQEPLLFSGSILDNIKYGRPNATQQEVEAAARSANAHDFIAALPDGYNTQVCMCVGGVFGDVELKYRLLFCRCDGG